MFFGIKDRTCIALVVFLVLLGGVSLVHDLYDLWWGTTNLNNHMPIFLTIMTAIFIGIVIKTERLTRDSWGRRNGVLSELKRNSYTNPVNLPYDRFKDGSIE